VSRAEHIAQLRADAAELRALAERERAAGEDIDICASYWHAASDIDEDADALAKARTIDAVVALMGSWLERARLSAQGGEIVHRMMARQPRQLGAATAAGFKSLAAMHARHREIVERWTIVRAEVATDKAAFAVLLERFGWARSTVERAIGKRRRQP